MATIVPQKIILKGASGRIVAHATIMLDLDTIFIVVTENELSKLHYDNSHPAEDNSEECNMGNCIT